MRDQFKNEPKPRVDKVYFSKKFTINTLNF